LAAGVEQLGYQVLMLVKQFWTEERTIRTWSRDGVLEVEHFRGSDLGEHLDVHVSAESALPRSKTARTQLAMDLFQAGILTEPRDLVRMLDLPGTDFLVETLNVDAAQANREHGYLLRGEDVLIRTFDNHAVHIAEHDKFRKSEEYEHLPPELQAHFDGHVDAHYQVVLQQMTQPTPPGTPMYENMVAQANAGMQNPSGENGQPTDPMTGAPSNPNAIGGNIPTGLNGAQAQASQTPIGGTGNPGPVPGHSRDTQMFREGN
jgi:hypothetical protein